MNLINVMRMTEDEARAMFERIRWGAGHFCPLCGCYKKQYALKGETKKGYYRCGHCKKDYTVRVGTVMHRSHIPLVKWAAAYYLVCCHKKGISSAQLARDIEVTQKTAWFLLHRIRHAMATESFNSPLEGVVEVDETYVGGKPRRGTTKSSRGYWSKKTPVVALIERGGKARAFAMPNISGGKLKQAIRENVGPGSTIMTDDAAGYKGIGHEYEGGHESVKHSMDEFARKTDKGTAHINTCESYFSLLKRGIYGVFHNVSAAHLQRYLSEFDFRWNHSDLPDDEQMMKAIDMAEGKRLMYRRPCIA